jgi:hypothetical protein
MNLFTKQYLSHTHRERDRQTDRQTERERGGGSVESKILSTTALEYSVFHCID